CMQALDFPWTF
nr:immunoglobulin light chain junction region [Macaca mulatta]MOV77837.1 immunoglobulin light chain junction region [Macaca mulatta]MOV77910.1 immunoglobulin light chain junction region [Macaca mulatta]MOV77975.1 immunoglobulin light chain junction region [Macaca mulatta]MOV77999.1 immunoglobulin light chain junction region [Macaca mulatta]